MKKTLGMMIAELRKEQGMTQLELAEKMGVTDKAVSKWERDLSCPDINSLPTLAALLNVSVDELMQLKKGASDPKKSPKEIINFIKRKQKELANQQVNKKLIYQDFKGIRF